MTRLNNTTREIVERSQMEFLNHNRMCVFVKAIPELIVGGKKIGPYISTAQANLPNWVIEKLIAHGVAELAQEENFESLGSLQKISRNEEDSPHKLQSFHPLLYSAISRKILNLQSDKSSLDERLYDEIEKLQRIVPMLLESRLSKLIRVAKSGALQDKRKDMTLEERWFCEELANLISDWRKSLFN